MSCQETTGATSTVNKTMQRCHPSSRDIGLDSTSINTSVSSSASTAASILARGMKDRPLSSHHRPILVGYAFGPKKMTTMSVVMAEASMAVSTVVTQFPPHLRNNNRNVKKSGVKRKLRQQTPSASEDAATTVTVSTSNSEAFDTPSSPSSNSGNSINHHQRQNPMHPNGRRHKSSGDKEEFAAGGDGVPHPLSYDCDHESLSERYQNDDISISNSSIRRTPSRNDLELVETQSFVSGTGTLADDKDFAPLTNRQITCIFPTSFYISSSSSSLEESSLITATTNSTSTSSSATNVATTAVKSYSSSFNNSSSVQNTNGYLPQHLQPMRVDFVPLDLDSPLEEQHGGKFDAILHKMTEDILFKSQLSVDVNNYGRSGNDGETCTLDETDRQALKRIERLVKYREDHPACCLVDHPTNVQVLMSRADIANTLSECLKGVTTKSRISVRTPRFQVLRVPLDDDAMVAKQIDNASLQYPLIVKPLTAAGTKSSHKMGVLLGRHGLSKMNGNGPCLFQEYANHDELLYKVYVLGSKVWVFPRPSLPNLPVGESSSDGLGMANGFVEFDSQRPYPTLEDFGFLDADKQMKSCRSGSEDPLTVSEIRPVADAIRKAFGLELFGFDILVTKKQHFDGNSQQGTENVCEKEMLVVDVNYFPSYKEVTNFSQLLAQYLAQCGIEGRFRSFEAKRT